MLYYSSVVHSGFTNVKGLPLTIGSNTARLLQASLGITLAASGLLGLASLSAATATAEAQSAGHGRMHRMMDTMHGPIEDGEQTMDECSDMMSGGMDSMMSSRSAQS
jgi:hypothetical protein